MQVQILPAAPIANCQVVSKEHDGLLNRTVLVRVQPWQPIFLGVMSAADGLPRKEEDAGAIPATLTIPDGWQSSNAPVPKTERASGLRGCNPYTIRHRPVAQAEPRLITGRRRSIPCRDDHFMAVRKHPK